MGYIYCPREKESCERNDRGESLANDYSANYLFRFNSLSTRLSSLWVVFRELDTEHRASYRETNSRAFVRFREKSTRILLLLPWKERNLLKRLEESRSSSFPSFELCILTIYGKKTIHDVILFLSLFFLFLVNINVPLSLGYLWRFIHLWRIYICDNIHIDIYVHNMQRYIRYPNCCN